MIYTYTLTYTYTDIYLYIKSLLEKFNVAMTASVLSGRLYSLSLAHQSAEEEALYTWMDWAFQTNITYIHTHYHHTFITPTLSEANQSWTQPESTCK